MVAIVAVLFVATLVLLVAWGLRVMHDIDELENLPGARRFGGGEPEAPAPQVVRLVHNPEPWAS